MDLNLTINGANHQIDVSPGDTLLKVLRQLGYFSVKHGCETGECGACTVLIDGKPANTCVHLAVQAEGHRIETIEALGQHPEQGWKSTSGLHPLQAAFVESGAIQCGFCTPAMILVAKQLLDENPHPSEAEVREVLSGVLCRCTGYLKPVQAVLRAAAALRGESVEPVGSGIPAPPEWLAGDGNPPAHSTGELFPGTADSPETAISLPRLMPRIQVTP